MSHPAAEGRGFPGPTSGPPGPPPPPPGGPPAPTVSPTTPPPAPSRRAETSPGVRAWVSVILAQVLTPVGCWWAILSSMTVADEVEPALGDSQSDVYYGVLFMILGLLALVAAAACGRLSWVGPVVAAVVWCGVPLVIWQLDLELFRALVEQFDEPLADYLEEFALSVFPIIGAPLVGAGIAGGRSRRQT